MPEEVQQPVQPQGQGGAEEGSGLYDLSHASPELRPLLEAELRKIEGNVTRRFQEASDYRKGWEPYEELGVQDVSPEELSALLAFAEMASNPESEEFEDWWTQVGEQYGFFEEAQPEDGQGQDPTAVLEALLERRLGPLEEAYRAQDQERRVHAATQEIESQLAGLHDKHGDFDEDAVCQLALAYDAPDAIERGLADYQRLVGQTERGLVAQKLGQPAPAESGGRPDTTPEPITSFDDARKAAAQRFAAAP